MLMFGNQRTLAEKHFRQDGSTGGAVIGTMEQQPNVRSGYDV